MSAVESVGGKMRAPIPGSGNTMRDRASVERERGGDLGADEAGADHDEAGAAVGEPAQAAVVVDGSEVDDVLAAEREPARSPARREQQPLVGVGLAAVVARRASLQVEPDDAPAGLKI